LRRLRLTQRLTQNVTRKKLKENCFKIKNKWKGSSTSTVGYKTAHRVLEIQ